MKKGFSHYQIAYRVNGGKYKLIPNPDYAWAADPFLVNYKGVIYLFAELFLYKSERNGVIGYCVYENGVWSDWSVTMDKHFHLSYPNVFVENDTLLMCPESYENEEIAIYELESFPNRWKKKSVLLMNEICVDTTFVEFNDICYMYTFNVVPKTCDGKAYIYIIENGMPKDPVFVTDDKRCARPGGNFFTANNKLIRVGQFNENYYGEGLVFSEVDSIYPKYSEHEIKRLFVKDINPDWADRFIGTHTYNRLGNIEVVDLKYPSFTEEEYEAQQRVRKVFMNKY